VHSPRASHIPVLIAVLLFAGTPPPFATGSPGQSAADSAASAIFIVRHAERADAARSGQPPASMTPPADNRMTGPANPGLSPAGDARAARLAAMLRAAGIARIFTTEFARTRATAEPLARSSGVPVVALPANDLPALMARLSERGGPALVVGHSNTIPEILKALGVKEHITIGDAEYDNLFIVIRHGGGSQLVALKF
jgi:phosphohistidine phosphatase SixA